jgi:serine/threonine protein kinase
MQWKDLGNVIRIAEGSFGTVYRCDYEEKIIAVKVYKSKCNEFEQIFKSALDLAKRIKHPNLISCYNYFYDKVDDDVHLISSLEYVKGTHIHMIKGLKKKMQLYLPGIVAGLKYLHTNKVIHRDIKAENILVNDEDKVKIIDYDFLKRSETGIFDCKNGVSGTLLYTAPEIFEKKNFTFSADLWSLGVTLYYSLSWEMPFLAKDRAALKDLILSNFVPDFSLIPELYREIVCKLLIKDPLQRLTLKEILELLKNIS